MPDIDQSVSKNSPESEPSLLDQTIELSKILRSIAEKDPEGHPSPAAIQAFHSWLAVSRNFSDEPQYLDEVLENYDAAGRSNRDINDLFEMLHPYVNIADDRPFEDEDEDDKPPRVFIGLPTV